MNLNHISLNLIETLGLCVKKKKIRWFWDSYIAFFLQTYLLSELLSKTCFESIILSFGEARSFEAINWIYTFIFGFFEPISQTNQDQNAYDPLGTSKFKDLWVLCDFCEELTYHKFCKERLHICEYCDSYIKMSSKERIALLLDPDTWNPMDQEMRSLDPIQFDHIEEEMFWFSDIATFLYPDTQLRELPWWNKRKWEEMPEDDDFDFEMPKDEEIEIEIEIDHEPYIEKIQRNQTETKLTEAIETGTGQLNGIPIAIGVMDFAFIGGSMGSAVGEKITRLIEYATNTHLPLILVCASGGARMQEGSLSLMQMAKISSALHTYQLNKKLFLISILTSPTTGGVTASFGMLGDIIIAEPDAYIAFAGKRVIEETLKLEVPEGSQEAEIAFEKGLVDLIVPRNLLKSVLTELFHLHAFFPLNPKSNN